ncbi:class A beta-lactamase [Streptacidiphilus albus]|uniref:class A beta-lactamase n=1 Tax=Streptacidiphilus albus TaxID=105425 RepID=UPI0005AA3BF8|nr:class A beta-lactamase [Streptacidiphilus albus]
MELRPSRRGVLVGAAGTALTVVLPSGGRAFAQGADGEGITARLRALERAHSARLGVFAADTVTGRTVGYRADELFAMCSTSKTVTVAAILRDLDRDGRFLAERVRYTEQDVTGSGYAPITGLPGNLAHGMTVADLCAAAIEYSDNTAANLLLREIGGPPAFTRFCRSIGDGVTRLDRWEPALNSAEPGRVTDTTSPRAIGRTYARLVLGDVLGARHRERLTGWLLADTTSGNRFRAGLPKDWTLADKTGTGGYGTANDVGIAWPPGRGPVVLSVLTTKHVSTAPADEPLVAEAAALLAAALG